ncbi:MAG: isoaspartyl peptidase/L-asparaginase [Bacteroidia bacterium]|nr:isoaspartyl peptidase/L-asparaginase [Bacteroidia bacterium]MCZ2277026.1 isoaspartyl peptidase/L-asparaginase [Bacteroidia bacterium]
MDYTPTIVIHGGAGTILKSSISDEQERSYHRALSESLISGNITLQRGGHALDAVTAAVVSLEDCPLFNAGKGSVFNRNGKHEMDASVMSGDSGLAGAVAGVRNIRNPVLAARLVMEQTQHVMLIGEGAEELAKKAGLVFESDEYFFNEFRFNQWKDLHGSDKTQLDHSDKKFGTVGAVAIDSYGNVAAATSTGGLTNKPPGRIGDTPIIGAGTYASNQTCAVSCTGDGEFFIRGIVAYDVACLIEYSGLSLEQACNKVILEKLTKSGGEGGLIAINRDSQVVMVFNTPGMYRGMIKNGKVLTSIF